MTLPIMLLYRRVGTYALTWLQDLLRFGIVGDVRLGSCELSFNCIWSYVLPELGLIQPLKPCEPTLQFVRIQLRSRLMFSATGLLLIHGCLSDRLLLSWSILPEFRIHPPSFWLDATVHMASPIEGRWPRCNLLWAAYILCAIYWTCPASQARRYACYWGTAAHSDWVWSWPFDHILFWGEQCFCHMAQPGDQASCVPVMARCQDLP